MNVGQTLFFMKSLKTVSVLIWLLFLFAVWKCAVSLNYICVFITEVMEY